MYKILLNYGSPKLTNLYEVYGTTTTSGITTVFDEWKTDNLDVLKAKIVELTSTTGYENIRVINDLTYSVNVIMSDTSSSTSSGNTESGSETESTETTA